MYVCMYVCKYINVYLYVYACYDVNIHAYLYTHMHLTIVLRCRTVHCPGVLSTYDHQKQTQLISNSVSSSFQVSAAMQAASALSMGGLVALHLVDITSILATSRSAGFT